MTQLHTQTHRAENPFTGINNVQASTRAVAMSKEASTASTLFCSILAAYRRTNSKGCACASWW